MKSYHKLVWKLIDREISDQEFQELQLKLSENHDLRAYYQQCLETESTLANRHNTPFLSFANERSSAGSNKFTSFNSYIGWAAAVIVLFISFFYNFSQPQAKLVASKNADWRGLAVEVGELLPNEMLHLKNGAIEIDFPSNTKVVVESPSYFQITGDSSMIIAKGSLTATHNGQPGEFSIDTPVGSIIDLGTQFGVFVDHGYEESTVITKVFEGNIKFQSMDGNKQFFNEGESAIIRGTSEGNEVRISSNHPYAKLKACPTIDDYSSKPAKVVHSLYGKETQEDSEKKTNTFDAVELMLQENLSAQINYSMVKSIAGAIDKKVQILSLAQSQYSTKENITFAEAAMPEIEAMGESIVDSYVQFQKIRFWEACQTAEIIWDEVKDQNGKVTHRTPHAQRLDQPKQGNRLLANLEKIRQWVTDVHVIHQDRGMGWASKFACPQDGKSIFDKRNKNLLAISYAIDSIRSNVD